MRDLAVYLVFLVFSFACHLVGRRGAVALGYLVGLGTAAADHRAARLLRRVARAVGWKRARSVPKEYYEPVGLLAVEYARLDTGLSPSRAPARGLDLR